MLYTPGLKDHHMRNQGRTEIPAIVTGIVDEEKKVVNLYCFPDLANPDARGGIPHFSSSPDISDWLGSWRFFDENTAEENADHTPILPEGMKVEEFPGKQSTGVAYGVDPYATGDADKEPAKVVALGEQKNSGQQETQTETASTSESVTHPEQTQSSGPSDEDPNALKAGSVDGASSGEQLGEQKEAGSTKATDELQEGQSIPQNLPVENQNASLVEAAPEPESKPQE